MIRGNRFRSLLFVLLQKIQIFDNRILCYVVLVHLEDKDQPRMSQRLILLRHRLPAHLHGGLRTPAEVDC